MALTIRDIDPKTRKSLDALKSQNNIKTDSKGMIFSVNEYVDNIDTIVSLRSEVETLESTIEDYEHILTGLEKYTSKLNEMIRQKELKL